VAESGRRGDGRRISYPLHDDSKAFATDKQSPESDQAPVLSAFVLP